MTSLLNLTDDSSDSENDLDYQPDVTQISDASISEDSVDTSDNEEKSPAKRRLKKSKKVKQPDTNPHENEPETSEIAELEKQKTDDLWQSFLSEVEETSKKEENNTKEQPLLSLTTSIEKRASEETADPLSKESSDTCIFEFAGETVSVSKDGSVASSVTSVETDCQLSSTSSSKAGIPAPAVKRKGLQSVLGTIGNKKQKLNVLQKSLMDWNSYKKEEGIEEELNKYNKGKGGYIERQRFLQRSDLKSYEVERELKLSKSKFSKI